MNRVKICTVLIALLSVIVFSGCYLFLPPAMQLQGKWEVDRAASPEAESFHSEFEFTSNVMTIRDDSNIVVEDGDITQIGDSTFEYTITTQTVYPGIVGDDNFADYSIERGRRMTLTFYDDSTRTTRFLTLYLDKVQ